jgi:hypothetical protein
VPAEPGRSVRPAAIATPFWDGVMVGGLSLFGMSAALGYVFVFGGTFPKFDKFDWVVLSILVNSTHFMASYRLLYDSWDRVKGAPWAAIYVPILLLALLAWRVFGPGRDAVADAILLVSSLYLAVHYTGQAWGMVASFGHLAGTRFERSERHAIRSGMRILLSLHVLLALRGRFPPAEWMSRVTYQQVYAGAFQIVCVLAAITLVIGAWGFWRARRRGQTIPVRAVLPWLSLYFWYPTWFLIPGGPLWVQLSHALQYLSFPLRVEANRFALRQKAKNLTRSPALHILLVYIGLVVAGTLVLKGAPLASRLIGQGWYSTPEMRGAFETWVLLINIHHFFIDGAVWKLRNPEVRRELFSHVHELEDVAPDRVSPS